MKNAFPLPPVGKPPPAKEAQQENAENVSTIGKRYFTPPYPILTKPLLTVAQVQKVNVRQPVFFQKNLTLPLNNIQDIQHTYNPMIPIENMAVCCLPRHTANVQQHTALYRPRCMLSCMFCMLF